MRPKATGWVSFLSGMCFLVMFFRMHALAYSSEECIRCHGQGTQDSSLQIAIDDFENSVHGSALSCVDCHTDINDESHMMLSGSNAVSCLECHEQENRHGLSGTMELRPKCYSCHTKHRIKGKTDSASSIHPKALHKTCAVCHPGECGQYDYLSWFVSLQVIFHGKADLSGKHERDNCVGCHQGSAAHGEKGPIDSQNCYTCHDSLWGSFHPKADPKDRPASFAAALLYQVLALFLLWGGVRFYVQRFMGNKGVRR